ncbi:unnamed protein product [Paramecium octaurelia]|uniref:Uncharacterized protein n=1 Tax=Paramecium octaurelia TaxID=43137 RepID=A0A8S1S7S5_PAROT|nr:unnamed protein product [Paramecium octaurelia]
MSSYRDQAFGINSRPSNDPLRFPQTITADIYNNFSQKPLANEQSSGLPFQFGSAPARAYAQELQLSPDIQVLAKQQQMQQHPAALPVQQKVIQPQPIYQEIQHFDKPVKVVSRSDIEEPWRNKCQFLERQIYDLQQENIRLRQSNIASEKVTYFEDTGRVNQLMQEIDRLNKTILDLNQEIDQWRQRYQSLEAQLKTRQNVEMEIERMRRSVQDNENIMHVEMNRLREQLDEWQKRCQSLESQSQDAQTYLAKSRTNEQQIFNLQADLKKAEMSLKSKQDDFEALQQKFNRLERVVRDSEYQSQEMANLRKIIDDRNKEIDILRRQSHSQFGNQSIKDLEGKLALFQGECERLNQLLNHKEQELQLYRDQLKRQSHYSNKQ